MQPRQQAARMEARRTIEVDAADRFAGYALVGLAFESGHIIAVRRATASSIGPPFTSVWLRSPAGEWSVYTNVDADRSCPRYGRRDASTVYSDDLDIRWNGPRSLSITVRRAQIRLALRLAATPATHVFSAAVRALPRAFWKHGPARSLARTLARVLALGQVPLTGRTAVGYSYAIRPRAVWRVKAAAALVQGRDLGSFVNLRERTLLGDFPLPAQPLFVAAEIEVTRDAVAAAATPARPSRGALLQRVLASGTATEAGRVR